MKRRFLLALLCLQALAMSADFLRGRVFDASNDEALPDVEVICKCSGDNWWLSPHSARGTSEKKIIIRIDFD